MKEKIAELARREKISGIGFCKIADYLEDAKDITEKPLFGKEAPKDSEILQNAQTAIVCAFNYYSGNEKGNMSRYARGEDYHLTVLRKMTPIAEFLKEEGYSAHIFADTGFLNERILAVESGIAFIGRNRMAISDKFGSYFFIGYILTDCDIPSDEKNTGKCLNCGKCVDACPLGALDDGFDETKCLSYITQKKGQLSEEEQNAIREANTIWGCDICQEVCPHNANIPVAEADEFRKDLIINLEIDENMSNREFMKIYKNRAFSWRGKGILLRNQKILQKMKKN